MLHACRHPHCMCRAPHSQLPVYALLECRAGPGLSSRPLGQILDSLFSSTLHQVAVINHCLSAWLAEPSPGVSGASGTVAVMLGL